MASDEMTLKEICQKAVDNNPKAVADFNGGEQKAVFFLVGQATREVKPQVLHKIILSILNSTTEEKDSTVE